MQIKSMKDLDRLSIEQIIRLPFFYSLKRSQVNPLNLETTPFWEIQFKCSRVNADGMWQLLDLESSDEFITRFKIIDPQPAARELIVRTLELEGVAFMERNKIIELPRGAIKGAVLRRILEMGVENVYIQEGVILLSFKE